MSQRVREINEFSKEKCSKKKAGEKRSLCIRENSP